MILDTVKSTSVISVCGRRRLTGRRVNVQYILDLLAFAVETGRLTEACANVVRQIIENPNAHELATVGAPSKLGAPAPPGAAPTFSTITGTSSGAAPYVDEETVLRDVRFRKTYHGLRRATPCGLNPYDKTNAPNYVCGAFCEQGAFDISATPEIFEGDTLEDLLAKLELCLGTPVESIKQAVRVKRELVRRLLRRERPNVYKRLARALDQRVPPDQRLLATRSTRKQLKSDDTLPSCWSRPIGSQLFRNSPTKLSDFMTQNDQS